MQAELEVKPGKKSFYQTHIRPALVRLVHPRRRSVWNVSLEDELETSVWDVGQSIVARITSSMFLLIGQVVLILVPALYVAQLVFLTPGGLAGLVARQLADICLGGGSCDLSTLLASYAFAVIMSVNIIGFLLFSLLSSTGYFDQADGQDEVLALSVIDERVKLLHDELIAAKVLPEPAEDPDDDL